MVTVGGVAHHAESDRIATQTAPRVLESFILSGPPDREECGIYDYISLAWDGGTRMCSCHSLRTIAVKTVNRRVRGELPAEIAKKNIAKIVNERGLI
jgi:hypothetical protein